MNQRIGLQVLVLGGVALLLAACAHKSTIIPFQQGANKAVAVEPTLPDNVGIYRHSKPFKSYSELGLITFRTESYELPYIYKVLRTDAAAQGADAVIDTKVKGESHTEYKTEQKCVQRNVCDANGVCTNVDDCHDEQVAQNVTTYLVEGSMIKRTK